MEPSKKILLLIVDGFGYEINERGNAVKLAKLKFWEKLCSQYPNTLLNASGVHVGLPKGIMGNSEVGHLTIGTGRVSYQSLEKVNKLFNNNDFSSSTIYQDINTHLTNYSGNIHLIGLLGEGNVHSSQNHLYSLIDTLHSISKNIFIHGFTDGRDTSPNSAIEYVGTLIEYIKKYQNAHLSSLVGRYYAMDRDNKWDRTKIAYDCLIHGIGESSNDFISTISNRYDNNETDEFLKPIIGKDYSKINSGDIVLFFNFRPDRARQLTQAINYKVEFKTKKFEKLLFITMSQYNETWNLPTIIKKAEIKNSIAEVLSKHKLPQLHIAETEKYAHVTYFLNGGLEEPFELEDRILVESPKIPTYDLKPSMSTEQIVLSLKTQLKVKSYPFIVINIACPDMVGHTGSIDATINALKATDNAFSEIYKLTKMYGYTLLITSDHGNSEKMLDGDNPHTAHTTNKVPFLITDNMVQIYHDKGLSNIAPAILNYLSLPVPFEMTNDILFEIKNI